MCHNECVCEVFPVYGYLPDNPNVCCEKHKADDMVFTFKKDDFYNYDVFDMKAGYKKCNNIKQRM